MQKIAVPLHNIEYRWITLEPSAYIKHILKSSVDTFEEIKKYNDTPELNSFYKACLTEFANDKVIRHLFQHQQITFENYKKNYLKTENFY